MTSNIYDETTRKIRVTVSPQYLEEQSVPEEQYFVWSYHVNIENTGKETVQLLNRHWRIADSMGRVQEVNGEGVVGEQPVLSPGENFEYTSGAPLTTASGMMVGRYEMTTRDGETFWISVPAFSLDSPMDSPSIN